MFDYMGLLQIHLGVLHNIEYMHYFTKSEKFEFFDVRPRGFWKSACRHVLLYCTLDKASPFIVSGSLCGYHVGKTFASQMRNYC